MHPSEPLEGIKLLILPHWVSFDPQWVEGLRAWVNAGGVLVIGARSGGRDAHGRMRSTSLPGPLRGLAGCRVVEYGRRNNPSGRPLHYLVDNQPVEAGPWYEELEPKGAEVMATWQDRSLKGIPALTRHRVGDGRVYYLGAWMHERALEALLPELRDVAGVSPQWEPAQKAGVEVVVREIGGQELWFFINDRAETVRLDSLPEGEDLLGSGSELEPFGLRVILRRP